MIAKALGRGRLPSGSEVTVSVVVICSPHVCGHLGPQLTIGRHLADQGYRVVVLTGSRFADAVRRAGLEHVALPPDADFDDRDLDVSFPGRDRHRGIAKVRFDIERMFVRPIPAQSRALRTLVDSVGPDAILCDSAFAGGLPMLLGDGPRPPIVGIGVLPLTQSSRDVAPTGLGLQPSATPLGRLRNAVLNRFVLTVVFGSTQRLAKAMLAEVGAPSPRGFVLDLSGMFDRFLQLSVPEFEYPRSDLRPNTRLVGALLPFHEPGAFVPPPWWSDLEAGRPVLLVTQGTIDNRDLGRLIGPTIEAVGGRDVLLVVTTGGRPVAELGPLPANVRAAEYIPYEELLPHVDLLVTNAGFGGVQYALSHGVPVIAAGDTEDKPEVAARVTYSGVGIDLRTGRPTSAAIGAAVDRILSSDRYADAASWVARSIAGHDPLTAIEEELQALIDGRKDLPEDRIPRARPEADEAV